MESIGLELVTDMAKSTSSKRDGLVHMIISFTPQTFNARSRILEKLADCFKSDLKNLSSILAYMSSYPIDGGMDSAIFDFYWYKAIKIINYSYPTMKTNGLKILSEISKYNISKLHLYLPQIHQLSEENWWEIKVQILIFCANQLEYVQNQENIEFQNQQGQEDSINENNLDEDGSVRKSHDLDGQSNPSPIGADNSGILNASDSGMHQTQDSKPLDMEAFNQVKDEYVDNLIEIIKKIFHRHQNVNVLKVGLVYLAKILNYYPELCERYLQVLLNINDEIKRSILNTDESAIVKSNIVLSKFSHSLSHFLIF
jgi:hypothetical protein